MIKRWPRSSGPLTADMTQKRNFHSRLFAACAPSPVPKVKTARPEVKGKILTSSHRYISASIVKLQVRYCKSMAISAVAEATGNLLETKSVIPFETSCYSSLSQVAPLNK